jgi:hypothetical protein
MPTHRKHTRLCMLSLQPRLTLHADLTDIGLCRLVSGRVHFSSAMYTSPSERDSLWAQINNWSSEFGCNRPSCLCIVRHLQCVMHSNKLVPCGDTPSPLAPLYKNRRQHKYRQQLERLLLSNLGEVVFPLPSLNMFWSFQSV